MSGSKDSSVALSVSFIGLRFYLVRAVLLSCPCQHFRPHLNAVAYFLESAGRKLKSVFSLAKG